MRVVWGLVGIIALLSLLAPAQAADVNELQQQLASLNTEIARLDGEIAEAGDKRAEFQKTIEAFTGSLAANKALGEKVRELNANLATRKTQLESEQKAATETCSRKVTQREYKALLAQCEQARSAYQHDAEETQKEYEKVSAEYTRYEADSKRLETERAELEQKRQSVQQTQTSLHDQRDKAVKRYNELREELVTLAEQQK